VLVADACGSVNEQARQRSLDALTFDGSTTLTETATICDLFVRGGQ
jgi:hypothetical protein